ncbi:MAG: hypothetical protein AAFX87_16185 [Bacteroidota bacterium]
MKFLKNTFALALLVVGCFAMSCSDEFVTPLGTGGGGDGEDDDPPIVIGDTLGSKANRTVEIEMRSNDYAK